jgi:uroporphyrinogen-III synthase
MVGHAAAKDTDVVVFAASTLDGFVQELERYGISVTLLSGEENSPFRSLERWIFDIVGGEYDDVLFSTAHGVRFVCEYADQIRSRAAFLKGLRSSRLIAAGRRTIAALAEEGLTPELSCRSLSADALEGLLASSTVHGHVVGVQAPSTDVPNVQTYFEGLGARPIFLRASTDRVLEAPSSLAVLAQRKPSVVVFAAPGQVRSLLHSAEAEGRLGELDGALRQATIVCPEGAASLLRTRGYSPCSVPLRMLSSDGAADVLAAIGMPRHASPHAVSPNGGKQRLVIVGSGPVGHRLCERLVETEGAGHFDVTVLGEERVIAIDRVERIVSTTTGARYPYDTLVLAAGSSPFAGDVHPGEPAE